MVGPEPAPRPSGPSSEAEVSAALRAMALQVGADDLGLDQDDPDRVHGVLMELGHAQHVVTTVALLDGTASRYVSSGGGTVGAGEHETVAEAARSLVAMAQVLMGLTEPVSQFPLPTAGRAHFHLLTAGGGRTVGAFVDELEDRRHALAPLYESGRALSSRIDELGENQRG
ncbi:hypothetical protein [Aeromicrobium sp.]|uniref:hypothetical protein n=1 Tax=Aeromicrobium sp. TaxID=1871063 RepID=UPI003C442513